MAHYLRSIYCLAASFDLAYRSSSGRSYQNKNINRNCVVRVSLRPSDCNTALHTSRSQRCLEQLHTFHTAQLHPVSCKATNGSVANTGRIATDRPTWSLHKAFFSYSVNNATFCCWFPTPSSEHQTDALNTCQFPADTISPIRVPAAPRDVLRHVPFHCDVISRWTNSI